MVLDVRFSETRQSFDVDFGQIQTADDNAYERGYESGYDDGEVVGYQKGETVGHERGHAEGYADGHITGYAEGLAARTYENWTITLVDGSIIEKEVALL